MLGRKVTIPADTRIRYKMPSGVIVKTWGKNSSQRGKERTLLDMCGPWRKHKKPPIRNHSTKCATWWHHLLGVNRNSWEMEAFKSESFVVSDRHKWMMSWEMQNRIGLYHGTVDMQDAQSSCKIQKSYWLHLTVFPTFMQTGERSSSAGSFFL